MDATTAPAPGATGAASTATVARTYLRLGALNELQYRVNFWLQLLQSLVALGTAVAVIAVVFQYTTALGGWTENELLVLLGVHVLLGGVIQAIIQPNMTALLEDIVEGTFDFLLLKPVDAQLLVSVRGIKFWKLVDVVVGLGVITVGAVRLDRAPSVGEVATFLGLVLLGAVIVYCFWLLLTTASFWVVRMEHVTELFNGLYQAGRWPVSIYPGWMRLSFTVLIPLAFAVTLPAEALTGRMDTASLGLAIALTVGLVITTRVVWRTGLKHYAGASA